MTSNFTNLSSFTELFNVGDAVSGGWLISGFVVTLFASIFLYTIPIVGTSRSLLYTSFITGIILLLLNLQNYVDYWVLMADILLLAIGAFFTMRER